MKIREGSRYPQVLVALQFKLDHHDKSNQMRKEASILSNKSLRIPTFPLKRTPRGHNNSARNLHWHGISVSICDPLSTTSGRYSLPKQNLTIKCRSLDDVFGISSRVCLCRKSFGFSYRVVEING